MNLCRWNPKQKDPFYELINTDHPFFGLSLFPTLSHLAPSLNESWAPAVDISEEKDKIIVKVDLPGVKKEKISLSVDEHTFTIKGERKFEIEEKKEDYHRVERSYGVFERCLNLGIYVDASKIKASYKNGVLEVVVPKKEKSKEEQIVIEGN